MAKLIFCFVQIKSLFQNRSFYLLRSPLSYIIYDRRNRQGKQIIKSQSSPSVRPTCHCCQICCEQGMMKYLSRLNILMIVMDHFPPFINIFVVHIKKMKLLKSLIVIWGPRVLTLVVSERVFTLVILCNSWNDTKNLWLT